MGSLLPLNVRARRHVLAWRTCWGRATAVDYLDLLAVAARERNYRCVKPYQSDEFPSWTPVLWVLAFSPVSYVRLAVRVRATPGGTWGYYEVGRGRHGYLSPCGDTAHAVDQVDEILKHRMFPSTW